MDSQVKQDLFKIYKDALTPPFLGTIREWVEQNIILPPAYAIPGRLDLTISPYLLKPLKALENPNTYQVNFCAATQIGKSLVAEVLIPYWIINNPGPIFRIFHNKEVSDTFAETRLIPLLKNCEPVKLLLQHDRFSTRKSGIVLPHMAVTLGSSNSALQHGMSVKYLLCDEIHAWEPGQFNRFLARTTAFAGRRKIVCTSQPSKAGSEWEQIYSKGIIYEWQWLCPKCKTRQPFHWSKEKPDGSYAGFNWETILNKDGTTNIAESAKTTYLQCIHCEHTVNDTPQERRLLNDTGDYVLIKSDGELGVVSFNCPAFVYPNISFAEKAAQYMNAKRIKKLTFLDEQVETFVEQVLGKFYRADEQMEISKILTEIYNKDNLSGDWINVLGVDVQRIGKVKYWVARAWHKNGYESRRLGFGIARTWQDIEDTRKKFNVPLPLVHVDSGDPESTTEVYQQCLLHGDVLQQPGKPLQYISWQPTKGDGQKTSYKHPNNNNITRLYSPISPQDAQFPMDHKLRGLPVPLTLFSNYSLKTILTNLRDNRVEGVKWLVDHADEEYDKQMYSEGLVDVLDKKSGIPTQRWMQQGKENHYFDAEVLCLLGALRANAFSATKIDETVIRKIAESSERKEPSLQAA